MSTKEILQSHPVTILRKEISKTNIKGYSKMKKNEVIELMLKAENKEKFKHIQMAESKKTAPKGTHKMPDGKLMTGAVHSKSSKPVKAKPKKNAVDVVVDLKIVMSPIFDKKFNPKSVIDRINSKKDIDDINKEITIIQKKVKETAGKLKSSGKENEAERQQLQKLQEKYTKRLKSVIKSMKEGASYL
tara:strand:- start:590 stop:1153 length:564 start_codon:yes stop_codon:yes gene_type:complete